jgi:hypothetical protein
MGTIYWMMTRKKTKKRRFDPLFHFFRHPHSPFGYLTLVRPAIALLGLVWFTGASFASAPGGATQNSSGSHAHDFVIFVTVLTDKGFAFMGARARVRRTDEKKFRWEATSDHQGELAFRVPPGSEYELTIQARGFKSHSRIINARQDNRADLTIRMEPQTQPQSEPNSEPGTGGKL